MVRFQEDLIAPDRRAPCPRRHHRRRGAGRHRQLRVANPARDRRDGPAARCRHGDRRHPARRRHGHGAAGHGDGAVHTALDLEEGLAYLAERGRRAAGGGQPAVSDLEDLARDYRAAFLRYLPRSGARRQSRPGTSSGGARSSGGLSLLDMVHVHHRVLTEVLATQPPRTPGRSPTPRGRSSARSSRRSTWPTGRSTTPRRGTSERDRHPPVRVATGRGSWPLTSLPGVPHPRGVGVPPPPSSGTPRRSSSPRSSRPTSWARCC